MLTLQEQQNNLRKLIQRKKHEQSAWGRISYWINKELKKNSQAIEMMEEDLKELENTTI